MDQQGLSVAAIDIGTNSIRLLITDGRADLCRVTTVTGLGRGVDASGKLSEAAIVRTLDVLGSYRKTVDAHSVTGLKAVATSASRDAGNREEFFDRVEAVIGVRPVLLSGDEEAGLAFAGATIDLDTTSEVIVSDIGGGSTEFVTADGGISIDVGSVRLTERVLPDRPPSPAQLEASHQVVDDKFSGVDVHGEILIGVAGTWTSLAAIALRLPRYDRSVVHGAEISRWQVDEVVGELAGLTVEETEAIPSLDPNRAPVILAGAVVAAGVLRAVSIDWAAVSEHDTLDAVATELLALL